MDRYKKLITAVAVMMMVFGLSVAASAQWRDRDQNDDWGRNRRDDDNYGRNVANLNYTIKNLKKNSRQFERTLDRELDRSRYNGTAREDNLNRLAKRFKNAAEDLDDEFEGRGSMRSSTDEARRVINYGSQLDNALSQSRLTNRNYNLQNTWRSIENDMHTISRAYNIRYNGTYSRVGNRGPIGGNGRGRIGNGQYNRNLRATIENLKNSSRRLENKIERDSRNDRDGRRNNYSRNLENLAESFRKATAKLEDEYRNDRDFNDSYDEARRVLNLGERLDSEISRNRVSSNIRSDWNRIEQDLRVLANAYNLSYNGNRDRGGFGIGDIFRNFPF